MISLYHQTKILISFWCKRKLNPKYFIQSSEILPIELTETHNQSLSWFLDENVFLVSHGKINLYVKFGALDLNTKTYLWAIFGCFGQMFKKLLIVFADKEDDKMVTFAKHPSAIHVSTSSFRQLAHCKSRN